MSNLLMEKEVAENCKVLLQVLAKEANELSTEALNCSIMGMEHYRDHRFTNLQRLCQELTDVVSTYHRLVDEMCLDGMYINDLIERSPDRIERKEAILEVEMLCVRHNLGSVPREGFAGVINYYIKLNNIPINDKFESTLLEYKKMSNTNRWYKTIYSYFTQYIKKA